MLPESLKQKLDADVAAAAAKGEDALEETAVGLAQTFSNRARQTASAAEAWLLFAAARHAVGCGLARLPGRPGLMAVAGSIALAESMRTANQQARLALLAEAESLYRRVLELQPDDIATSGNLGVLLSERGDLALDGAECLAAYHGAETLFRRILDSQHNQIAALCNLGGLLQTRGGLEPCRAERLAVYAKAEECYQRVLQLHSDDFRTLGNLALLLKSRGDIQLSRTERLQTYKEAEALYRRIIDLQPDYIGVLGNLGALLQSRAELEPTRAERVKAYVEAERLHRHILGLQPDDPDTLANLGLLLKNRSDLEPGRADRLNGYKEAETLFHRVLKSQPHHIGALGNLGALLQSRGDMEATSAERLRAYDQAEILYKLVLEHRPHQIETLVNFAVLLQTRGDLKPKRTDRLNLYRRAEIIYRRVLALQPDHIATLGNLGALISTRARLEPRLAKGHLADHEAERLYLRVLELQPEKLETLINLGRLQRNRAQLAAGVERCRLITDAAAFSSRVLEHDPTEIRAMRILMITRLDALQLEDGGKDWPSCAREAAELLERRRSFASVTTDPHFRTELSSAAWPLGPLGAVCHLRAGDSAAAVGHLDANMAMSLAEALATPERRLAELERIGETAAAQRFVLARDAVDARMTERADLLQAPKGDTAEAEVARRAEIEALGQEIKALEQERDAAIADIRAISGFDDFLRPGGDISLIKAAARERPLVYLAASPWGGHALVVQGDAIDDVPLPDLTDEAVGERLEAWRDAYLGHLVASSAARLRRDSRFPPVTGNQAAAPAARDQAETAFAEATRSLCLWLGEAVMQPVLAALERRGVGRAVLLPAGQLSYLPLHAAIVGGSDQRPELALKRLQLGYAANARLALASATSLAAPPAAPPKVTALLDPAYGHGGPTRLAGCSAEQAVLESHAAAGRIGLACHAGAAARVSPPAAAEGSFPVAELAEANILHLGCHGASNHADVFNSCLLLAPDSEDATEQRVPISTVLDTWPVDRLRLVVLSCCEGAMSGRQSFDELVSLQTAFAQGGAAAVVGAMWAVRDDHTAALMAQFYDALLADPALDPAKALAVAQARLLDTTPEAFPAIAAFQVLQG